MLNRILNFPFAFLLTTIAWSFQLFAENVTPVIVAIDAGHGGKDVGAIGATGVYENDITLAIPQKLAGLIEQTPGMKAVLTRKNDVYVKLRTRLGIARNKNADLFVSIHADAFKDPNVKGSSVYILSSSGASGEAAKYLARRANFDQLVDGVSLRDKDEFLSRTLIDMTQTAAIEESRLLGEEVLAGLRTLGPVHKKQVQKAGFVVLKSPDIPSILIETAFISNPSEEKRLTRKGFQTQLSKVVYQGIISYLNKHQIDSHIAKNYKSYRVVRGDTLSELSAKYGVSVMDLRRVNSLENSLVKVGETLKIPIGRTLRRHRVTKGDTLSELSKFYKVSVESITRINGIKGDKIVSGEILKIP
jgi:N-acetylmuramoyl-L-alanine amidase